MKVGGNNLYSTLNTSSIPPNKENDSNRARLQSSPRMCNGLLCRVTNSKLNETRQGDSQGVK